MSIRLAATKATVDVLTTVSATASTLANATLIASDFAEAGREHSKVYLERTKHSLKLSEEELRLIAEDDARRRTIRRIMSLDAELENERFAELYAQLSAGQPIYAGTATAPALPAETA